MSFHRLAHTMRRNPSRPARWWHPFTEIAVFSLAMCVLTTAWYGINEALAAHFGVPASAYAAEDESHPFVLLDMLMYLILTIPAAFIAARVGGRRRAGALWSTAGRIRWGFLARCIPPVLVAYTVYGLLSIVFDGPGDFHVDQRALIMLALVLVFVPLQCVAEEVIFRAWLPQLIGTWVRSPWLPYSVCLPLFVFGHEYGALGLTDVAVFALCAAILTHVTCGIEAAIVLHVGGNLLAFGFEAVGIYASATSDADIHPITVLISVAFTAACTRAILRIWRRYGQAGHAAPVEERTATLSAARQPGAQHASTATGALPR